MKVEIQRHWQFRYEIVNSFCIVQLGFYDPVREIHIIVYNELGSDDYYDDEEDFA